VSTVGSRNALSEIVFGCLNICSPLNKYDDVVDLCSDGTAKDIRRRGRNSRNGLEVGDAKQSSVLSLISSAQRRSSLIADVTGAEYKN